MTLHATEDRTRLSRKLIHAGYQTFPYVTGIVGHVRRQRKLRGARSPPVADVLGITVDGGTLEADEDALARSIRFCRERGIRVLGFRDGVLPWAEEVARSAGAPYRYTKLPEDVDYRLSETDSQGNARYHAAIAQGLSAALVDRGWLEGHRSRPDAAQ